MGVINMVFKAVSLDEITKGVNRDKEKNRERGSTLDWIGENRLFHNIGKLPL